MRLTDELIDIARAVEALKRECSMDPESPTAIQNGRYMGVSHRLRTLAAELEKQAALDEVEIAGLTSSVGHLGTLVDEVRGLLRRSLDAMGALHAAAQPDENLAAVIPGEAFHAFVDEHAALLYAWKNGATALPSPSGTTEGGE